MVCKICVGLVSCQMKILTVLSKAIYNIWTNLYYRLHTNDSPASTDVLRTLYNGCGLVRLDQTFTQRCLNVIGTFSFYVIHQCWQNVVGTLSLLVVLRLNYKLMIYAIFFERCHNVIGTLIITYFTDVYKRSQNVM